MSTHVLLVESDAPSAARFSENVTALMDARITVAHSDADALALFEAGVRPDVALVAWGEGGPSSARLVRALRTHIPQLPILLVVREGAPPPQDMDSLGVQGVLTKPFLFSELPDALMQAISQAPRGGPASGVEKPTPVTEGDARGEAKPLAGPLLGHIELSQQEAGQLNGKLQEIGEVLDEMPLVLSQDGVLISHVGPISRDTAAAIARVAGRVWREGATRPTREWLCFDDQLPSESGERRSPMLYSVHVAGDVTISAAWDGGTLLSSLRADVLEAAQILGGLLPQAAH